MISRFARIQHPTYGYGAIEKVEEDFVTAFFAVGKTYRVPVSELTIEDVQPAKIGGQKEVRSVSSIDCALVHKTENLEFLFWLAKNCEITVSMGGHDATKKMVKNDFISFYRQATGEDALASPGFRWNTPVPWGLTMNVIFPLVPEAIYVDKEFDVRPRGKSKTTCVMTGTPLVKELFKMGFRLGSEHQFGAGD
jgi:hypothetical protein